MNSKASVAITQELVLVGGGHSHAIVLQMWAMDPLPGVRVTLVSDRTHTPYSGMLPGHVAGFYDFDECHIDLRRLCQAAGAQFYLDEATGLDLENQTLHCRAHPAIAYDWLSLDIGSTPAAVQVPGAPEHAIPAKPVPQFLERWEALVSSLTTEPRSLSLGIVGGGAGGVELTISVLARLRQVTPEIQHQLHLFQRGATLLPNHAPKVGRKFLSILQSQGVQVHLKGAVQSVSPLPQAQGLTVPAAYPPPLAIHHHQNGGTATTQCDRLFWVTHASAPAWLATAGLNTDERGFVLVNDTLQSISHPRILAAGDIATMVNHPRPKAGVFAVRQGKPLFENLRQLLKGRAAQPFIPQAKLLALIGTGTGAAVASRGRWSLGPSKLLWQWKDQIDRKFMERFSQLAIMGASLTPAAANSPSTKDISPLAAPAQLTSSTTEASPLPAMYCAGCGAKVGSSILNRTLGRLRDRFPELILNRPDDAAILELPTHQALIQSVDYFTALVSDPFIFGQITANHCLNDIFAMGAQPHSAMALVQVPHASDRALEETLHQLLSGALTVMAQSHTQLIGGHTVEGHDLAFGMSCNGLGHPDQLWRKGGIEPGQALILTKPLGTGTLFAAAAQGKAKGRWLDAAIATMLQSNAGAIEILRLHGATACTDVTGFGLLGHLNEMVQASGIGVTLALESLPILPGASATLGQGIVSSMERQNQTAQRGVSNWAESSNISQGERVQRRILFDPQTSGGLLVALPNAQANHCLVALQQQGYGHCRIIGQSTSAPGTSIQLV